MPMMKTVADKALEKLWARADRAALLGSNRLVSLRFSLKSFPDYHKIRTLDEKEACHALLRSGEEAGALCIHWDPMAGRHNHVDRIELRSLEALAKLLDKTTTVRKVARAESLLNEWRASFPVVDYALQRWREGRKARGLDVDYVQDLLDAFRLIEMRKGEEFRNESVRRTSSRLFKDSKRVENIVPAIDLAWQGAQYEPGRDTQAVLAEIGLVKYPLPFMLCGTGSVQCDSRSVPLIYPYLGVEPHTVSGYDGAPAYLLTVENLTIFHEIASKRAGPVEGLVCYTGGFPSPAFRRAFQTIVRDLSDDTPIYHWSDTDLAGFQIAEVLNRLLAEQGKRVQLWQMPYIDPEAVWRPLSENEVDRIVTICDRCGWQEAGGSVVNAKLASEQELQPLRLP